MIPNWAWAAFLGFVGFMLALDLGVFKKKANEAPSFKEAVAWCVVWVSLAVGFAFLLSAWRGPEDAELFAAGYVLELALSVDNLFIFILVFAHFSIPPHLQHRVLFWGILGAVAMRAIFIIAGIAAVDRFTILLPIFGAFLLFTGLKMAFSHDETEGKGVDENFVVRMIRRFLPVTNRLHGEAFIARENAYDLTLKGHRVKVGLLQDLDHAFTACELVLGGFVEVGRELREGLEFAVLGK